MPRNDGNDVRGGASILIPVRFSLRETNDSYVLPRYERVRTSKERISITLRVVLIATFGRSTYSSSSQRRLHKSRSKADQIKTNERTKRERAVTVREVERNCKFERNSGFRATSDNDTFSRSKLGARSTPRPTFPRSSRPVMSQLFNSPRVQRVRLKATDRRSCSRFYGREDKMERVSEMHVGRRHINEV